MKTLTAPAALAAGRSWAEPLYLLQIDLVIPSALTLRFADQYVGTAEDLGQEWLPMVAS